VVATRNERPTAEWDTAWVYPASSSEATLGVKVSPAGIHAFDASRNRLILISRAGRTLWEVTIDSQSVVGAVRDVEVDASGKTHVLHGPKRTIFVFDSLGRSTGVVPTRAVANAEQLVVLGGGKYVLHSIDKLRFPVVAASGRVEGHAPIAWPGLADHRPIARQLVSASDAAGGAFVLAARLGSGWITAAGAGEASAPRAYLEDRPFPVVMTVSNANGTSDRFVRYAGCTACDLAVADSSLYMLTGGTAQSAKQVVDRYDLRSGRYEESFRFGTRLQSIAVEGRRVYVVTEDPKTMLVALDRRP
jgi:hypothetical protein